MFIFTSYSQNVENVLDYIIIIITKSNEDWKVEVILVSVLGTSLPCMAHSTGSDHHFSICCPNSNSFLTMVGLYISSRD